MTWIAHCLTQAWTQDLIVALTHSLWQGVLIAALLYGLLNSLQKVRPQTRYGHGGIVCGKATHTGRACPKN